MDSEKKTIVLVEDDAVLSELIRDYLESQQFTVRVEPRGDRAEVVILRESPHLVILDLMLPGKDGLSVCRDLRAAYEGPVLILTAREDDMDQVAGLEIGADDYVKKPVKPRVLLARIRALLRRSQVDNYGLSRAGKRYGGLEIDFTSRTVVLHNQPVRLTTLEFDLLCLMASEADTVLNRDYLYQSIKGVDWDGLDRSIDSTISRLRKKLKDNPEDPFRIKTVWGSGYLFVADAWHEAERS